MKQGIQERVGETIGGKPAASIHESMEPDATAETVAFVAWPDLARGSKPSRYASRGRGVVISGRYSRRRRGYTCRRAGRRFNRLQYSHSPRAEQVKIIKRELLFLLPLAMTAFTQIKPPLAAPTSTKNADGERDPEMHQVKKGNEWHHGMKMHIGVDDGLGLIHSIVTTAANEHDITQADKLLHGDEQRVWGDAGYLGVDKREEHKTRAVNWFIAMRPGKRAKLVKSDPLAQAEKIKASVRAKVEHAFFYIKLVFHYSKVRYRGLDKNTNRLYVLAGLANLLRMKSCLLP